MGHVFWTLIAIFLFGFSQRALCVPVVESGKDPSRLSTPPLLLPLEPEVFSPSEESHGAEQGAALTPSPAEDAHFPDFTPVTLSIAQASRALDAFLTVRKKYKNSGIDAYETIEDFVDNAREGKGFLQEIQKYGFKTVSEWNTIVVTMIFAYSAEEEKLEDSVSSQVRAIEEDPSLDKALKIRIITSLRAMLPSEHNRKIIRALLKNADNAKKLQLLSKDSDD